jgi:hypothetical protein
MGRHSPTERIGVNTVEKIVLKDLGWIFRDQPIEDFGIDGIIEEVIEGNPTGRLIAAQIKTGDSHFKRNSGVRIYYASAVHRHYWVNYSIPVILIGIVDNLESAIWQSLEAKHFPLAKSQYKLSIPNHQILGDSKDQLTQILDRHYLDPKFRQRDFKKWDEGDIPDLFSAEERIRNVAKSTKSLKRTRNAMNDFSQEMDSLTPRIRIEQLVTTDANSPRIRPLLLTYCGILNDLAHRLIDEIERFAISYAEGLFAYEITYRRIAEYKAKLDAERRNDLTEGWRAVRNIAEGIVASLPILEKLKKSIQEGPELNRKFVEAKKRLAYALELWIQLHVDSKNLADRFLEYVESEYEFINRL